MLGGGPAWNAPIFPQAEQMCYSTCLAFSLSLGSPGSPALEADAAAPRPRATQRAEGRREGAPLPSQAPMAMARAQDSARLSSRPHNCPFSFSLSTLSLPLLFWWRTSALSEGPASGSGPQHRQRRRWLWSAPPQRRGHSGQRPGTALGRRATPRGIPSPFASETQRLALDSWSRQGAAASQHLCLCGGTQWRPKPGSSSPGRDTGERTSLIGIPARLCLSVKLRPKGILESSFAVSSEVGGM